MCSFSFGLVPALLLIFGGFFFGIGFGAGTWLIGRILK